MGKQFGPMLTSGNEPFVHHISIYACSHPKPILLEQYLKNEGSDCTDSANMPKDVGFPLGDENSHTFVLLNIHYDNPENIEGIVDSSGLELYYTKTHRKYEAFNMGIGSGFDNRFFVPPKQNNFWISGHCSTKCFQKVFIYSILFLICNKINNN